MNVARILLAAAAASLIALALSAPATAEVNSPQASIKCTVSVVEVWATRVDIVCEGVTPKPGQPNQFSLDAVKYPQLATQVAGLASMVMARKTPITVIYDTLAANNPPLCGSNCRKLDGINLMGQ